MNQVHVLLAQTGLVQLIILIPVANQVANRIRSGLEQVPPGAQQFTRQLTAARQGFDRNDASAWQMKQSSRDLTS